jgi:hypothetical protein
LPVLSLLEFAARVMGQTVVLQRPRFPTRRAVEPAGPGTDQRSRRRGRCPPRRRGRTPHQTPQRTKAGARPPVTCTTN